MTAAAREKMNARSAVRCMMPDRAGMTCSVNLGLQGFPVELITVEAPGFFFFETPS